MFQAKNVKAAVELHSNDVDDDYTPPTEFNALNYDIEAEERAKLNGASQFSIEQEKQLNRISTLEIMNGLKTLTPLINAIPADDVQVQLETLCALIKKSETFALKGMGILSIPKNKANQWVFNVFQRVFVEMLPKDWSALELRDYEFNDEMLNKAIDIVCKNEPVVNPDKMDYIKDGDLRVKVALFNVISTFMAFHKTISLKRNAEEDAKELADFLHNFAIDYIGNLHPLTTTNDRVQLYCITIKEIYKIFENEWSIYGKEKRAELQKMTPDERSRVFSEHKNGLPTDTIYKETATKAKFILNLIKEIRPNVKHLTV